MIGKYDTIKRLGEGAFGETYVAVDVVTRQKVALKVYKQLQDALEAANGSRAISSSQSVYTFRYLVYWSHYL